MKQKGFAPLIIVILVAVLGVVGYFSYKGYSAQKNTNDAITVPPTDPTANWKKFANEKYKYEFMYPPTWEVANTEDPGVGDGPLNTTTIKSDKNKSFASIMTERDLTWDKLKASAKERGLKEYKFNGMDSLIFNKTGYDTSIYLNSITGKLIAIQLYDTENTDPTFDLMLSTFKFTQ